MSNRKYIPNIYINYMGKKLNHNNLAYYEKEYESAFFLVNKIFWLIRKWRLINIIWQRANIEYIVTKLRNCLRNKKMQSH